MKTYEADLKGLATISFISKMLREVLAFSECDSIKRGQQHIAPTSHKTSRALFYTALT